MSKFSQNIGVFDSGVGGLTIYQELISMLPNEQFIYLADSLNAPYGELSQERIVELSFRNAQFLIDKGAKIIVVACNTATTSAIERLRKSFHVPFIGIEPAFKPAAQKSSSKKVGVLATKGTLNSSLFKQTSTTYGQNIETITVEGKGLVKLIEDGKRDSEDMKELLNSYLKPMIDAGVDHIVLGCTHYPLLKEQIQRLTPNKVTIIDSGLAVAKQTKRVLESQGIFNVQASGKPDQIFINGNADIAKKLLEELQINRETTLQSL